MELENDNLALFNSSTEFLVTFDSADDTRLAMPDQHCEDSSVVTGIKGAPDETAFGNGQTVKPADSEHIICEFSDVDTDWFTSSNAMAGESVNTEDVWLSLSCDDQTDAHESPAPTVLTAGEESYKLCADRKSDYIRHSTDFSSDFTAADDNATSKTTAVTPFQPVSTSCKTLTGEDQNQSLQLSALVPSTEQLITQHDFVQQDADFFSDFTAASNIVPESTDATQTQAVDTDGRKLGDGDKSQHMQLSGLFPDFDEFYQQHDDGDQVSVPACVTDQQLVESSDKFLAENHGINTSLPDVHSSAMKQDLICEFSDQLFSEEVIPDTAAQRSELSQSVADTSDVTVSIEDIQVCSLNC